MNQEKLAQLIKRYRSGTATAEEIALLEKIWSTDESKRALHSDHTEDQLAAIEQQMFDGIKNEIQKRERLSRRSIFLQPVFYRVAAAVLLLMAVAVWWYNTSNELLEIRTAFGEQRTVILPDQSSVKLNGNSVLKYATHWDENSPREVWIEGEGFFSVIHTANHQKFVVHGVSELNVVVLGTKFNVKTRQSDSEVMLAEGKVKLELGGQDTTRAVFLRPGELATVKRKKLSTQTVNQQRYTSWVANKLFFERTPLRDLSLVLRDTYGLKVTFADPTLEARELSGEISANTVDEILYAVGETLDLKIEQEGQQVTISSKDH